MSLAQYKRNIANKKDRCKKNSYLHADEGQYEIWNQPQNRRWSFHHLHTIVRYGFSLRAPEIAMKPD